MARADTHLVLAADALRAGLRMFRLVAVILLVVFLCSGVTRVQPDEVALLQRLGKLNGANPSQRVRQPGLLLALPEPIDRVVRVPARREGEIVIEDLWKSIAAQNSADALDPLRDGYCLMGDQSFLQARIVAKYRVSDPVAFHCRAVHPEAILKDVVIAAFSRSASGWAIDDALRLQRSGGDGSIERLAATAMAGAQQRLDQLALGVSIIALELKELHPPASVVEEFQRVQSARIEIETKKREAEGFANRVRLEAEGQRNSLAKSATAFASALAARAAAETSVFQQLHAEYCKSPRLVRERIHFETLEAVLQKVGKLDVVAPGAKVLLSDAEESR